MPLQGLTGGDIPWLINEPPSAALARGASVGQGIASSRLAASNQRLQADVHGAQEERLRMVAQRVAAKELSRQLGMQAASDEIQAFQGANPEATDEQLSKVRSNALFKRAAQIFDDPTDMVRFANDFDKNRIMEDSKRFLGQQKLEHEQTLRDKNRIIEELGHAKILSQKEIAELRDATKKLELKGNEAVDAATIKLKEAQAEQVLKETKDGKSYAPSEPEKRLKALQDLRKVRGETVSKLEEDIVLGVAPRPGVEHKLYREKFIESHLERKVADEGTRKKSRAKHIEELGVEFDLIFPPETTPAPTGSGTVERFMRGEKTSAAAPATRLSDEFKRSPFFKQKQ